MVEHAAAVLEASVHLMPPGAWLEGEKREGPFSGLRKEGVYGMYLLVILIKITTSELASKEFRSPGKFEGLSISQFVK